MDDVQCACGERTRVNVGWLRYTTANATRRAPEVRNTWWNTQVARDLKQWNWMRRNCSSLTQFGDQFRRDVARASAGMLTAWAFELNSLEC